jgi:translation initiation factor 5A
VPLIEKKSGQVIAIVGETVQLMDMETYQTFEISMPLEDEIKSKLAPGVEVEYWSILGKNKIVRVKS